MDFESARKELYRMREDGIRDSERIVDLWILYLSRLAYKLGDELWCVYEQVFTAAIDIGNDEVAQECLDGLTEKFPDSVRVQRLRGMQLESLDKFAEARSLYNKILEEDPTNMVVRKRLIAVLKAEGKVTEVIKELKDYLDKFMSDVEAWSELCDLYLNECDFRKAAFCMEELLLTNPHNHLYNQKYAEIKYSEGGLENLEMARAYFAQALTLHPDNVRALYGLFLSSSHLSQSSKMSANSRKTFTASAEWAASELTKLYDNARDLPLPQSPTLDDSSLSYGSGPLGLSHYSASQSATRANGALKLSQALQEMTLNSRLTSAPQVLDANNDSASSVTPSVSSVDEEDGEENGNEHYEEDVIEEAGDYSSSDEEDSSDLPILNETSPQVHRRPKHFAGSSHAPASSSAPLYPPHQ